MSWLSDFLSALKPSSREEHFWAKIAGEEELENEYIPSAREEGFMYKIAQKIAELSEGGGSGGGVWLEATQDTQTGAFVVDMPLDDVMEAMQNGALGFVVRLENGSAWALHRFYFNVAVNQTGMKLISAAQYDAAYTGRASEDGKTVFEPMS